jgi:hypothetical protein
VKALHNGSLASAAEGPSDGLTGGFLCCAVAVVPPSSLDISRVNCLCSVWVVLLLSSQEAVTHGGKCWCLLLTGNLVTKINPHVKKVTVHELEKHFL